MRSRPNADDRDIIQQWIAQSAGNKDAVSDRIRGAVARVLADVTHGRRPSLDDCDQVVAWMGGWRRSEVEKKGSGRAVAAFVVLMTAALGGCGDEVGGHG